MAQPTSGLGTPNAATPTAAKDENVIPVKRVPLTASDAAQQEIVTILVGSESKPYRLHKDLLRDRSPYFATRLKDCWDGTQEEIELKDVSIRAFEVAIDWMYTGRVPDYVANESGGRGPLAAELPELYHAADLLMMIELQNQLIDTDLSAENREGLVWGLRSVADAHAYEILHTPLYQLILRDCAKHLVNDPLSRDKFDAEMAAVREYPQAVLDMFRAFNDYHNSNWPYPHEDDWCKFHIHPDGQECHLQKQPHAR